MVFLLRIPKFRLFGILSKNTISPKDVSKKWCLKNDEFTQGWWVVSSFWSRSSCCRRQAQGDVDYQSGSVLFLSSLTIFIFFPDPNQGPRHSSECPGSWLGPVVVRVYGSSWFLSTPKIKLLMILSPRITSVLLVISSKVHVIQRSSWQFSTLFFFCIYHLPKQHNHEYQCLSFINFLNHHRFSVTISTLGFRLF